MLNLNQLFSRSKSRESKSKVSETPPITPPTSYTLPDHVANFSSVRRPDPKAPPASENQVVEALASYATSSSAASAAGEQRNQVADVAPEEDDGLTAEDRMEWNRILEKKKARARARQAEEEAKAKAGSAPGVRLIENSGEMDMVANYFGNTSVPGPQARMRTRDSPPPVDTIKNNAGGRMNGVANVFIGVSYAQGQATYQRNCGQL